MLNVKIKILHTFFWKKKKHVSGKLYIDDMSNLVSISLDFIQKN